MLKQRLLTAVILIPLFFLGVFYLPTERLSWVFAGLVLLAAWEWGGLMALSNRARALYVLLVGLLFPLAAWLYAQSAEAVLSVVLLAWLLSLYWLRSFDGEQSPISPFERGVLAVLGLLVLLPTWLSLVALHGQGRFGLELLLYLMLLVWGADTGAYFSGRRWGRRRLAPKVSPGKTWEGAYGALAMTLLLAVTATSYFGYSGGRAVQFILLSVITVLFSIVGDLFESMLKRRRGIKDSGQILPGHGGILDRIDSLTAAAPVFCLGLILQEFIL